MYELFRSKNLEKICKQYGINYLGLFGSYARGEESPQSDIDMLVQYKRPVGYLTHAKVQNTLEDYFGKPVDLTFKQSPKPRILPYAMRDLKILYEER